MTTFPRSRALATVVATAALVAATLVATAPAAYADDAVPGAQTAVPADTLFPNQGNGGYDVSHYDINLKINVAVSGTNNAVSNSTVPEATATIDATTTGAPLSSYSFDFQGSTGNLAASTFNVSAVTVNGVPATFSRIENTTTTNAVTDNHKLIITPAAPVDGAFTTVVTYGGTPVRHTDTDGSAEGWNNTVDGATFLNQPVGSMTLFPNNNTPRDKATYKFTINAPTTLTTSNTAASANPGIKNAAVASNGELTSKTVSGDGTRTTWVWEELKPMASELSMVSVGRYDVYESDITLASGRTIHEWSFIDPSISVANQTATQLSRTRLKTVLDFFESKYGPYPGNSTGVVTDIVPSAINYALETQDRPFFPNTSSAFVHEIMHQWWGDGVAPGDWNDIWLNEGPATVAETQVPFESQGSTTTTTTESSRYSLWNSTASGNSFWNVPSAAMTQGSQLFGSQVYDRGSMALAALRVVMGDVNFELLMKQEQLVNTGTSRRTSEFIARAQAISGKDLTAFFNSWIYTSGKPAWPNKFTYGVTQPSAALSEGGAFNLTLNNRNTGRVAETGAVVSIDITDILDDATIGTLPANVTQSGNVLTWAIPTTALATSNTAVIPFTINAATLGHTLSGTVTTGSTMLGGTCFNCSFSAIVGATEISPAPTPTLSNPTPVYGQALTVDPGVWADGTTLSYQWTVDNIPIQGATGTSYTPDVFTPGLVVRAQVTGTNGTSLPTVRTVAATAGVVRAIQAGDTPTISGTPQIGKPLTASPGSGWLAGTFFTYQWKANTVNISGATGPSYTPTLATQIGQTFTVAVTGTKAGYTTQAAVTSGQTAAAVTGVQALTPTPTISGNARALAVQTALPGTWDDGVTLTYAWSADGTPIAAATASTYTPTVGQIGQALTVTVTSTKSGFTTVSKTSAPTTILPAAQTLQPTPTISGTPTVWQELTLTPGTWDAGTAQAYQWLADGSPIDGATGLTYTLQPTDAGKVITASVTSTRTNYSTVVKTSLPTAAVALATQTLTPTPTVSGTPEVGTQLTATAGDWDSGVDLAYQWLADGNPIGSATDSTFTPGAPQIGAVITVSVTGTKLGYATVTTTSDPTAAVAVGVFDPAPVPTISGTAKVGVELTAVTGTWDTDADLAYQWFADGDEIDGAIESTFTPGPARVGAVITVAVTATQDGFTTVTKTSDPTEAVVKGSQSSTPDPTIVGTAKVDVLLTALPGTWDAETTLSYQWYADDVAIDGEDTSEFTPDASFVGDVITVVVTGTRDGYDTVVKTSAATDPVAAGDIVLTPTPTITGSGSQVGVQLTAVAGTWTSGVDLAYQWYADGGALGGETGTTFTPGATEIGTEITVSVTGSKTGYTTVVKTSAPTSDVLIGTQTLQPIPTITGIAKYNVQLTAHPGTWDAGTSQAIQWYADGNPIGGATGTTFTPGASEIGTTIVVKVTSTKNGYTTVTTESTATAAVAAQQLVTTPVPKIVGTPKVGSLLTVVTTQWESGVTLAYEWKANGTPVAGGTATTFVPSSAEAGKLITVSVTGSKPTYASVTKTSLPTKAVALGSLVSTPVPTIAGTTRVGATLTVVPGAWDAGTTLAYQWKRGSVAIGGATGVSYTAVPGDRGSRINVVVTGSKPGYATVAKTGTSAVIGNGIQVLRPRPVITGTFAVGGTLTVAPEVHDAGAVVTYAWYANGKKVGSGTSLLLTTKMRHDEIWVTSTSKKSGYATVVVSSVKTPKL